jgi:hypothetical protein
MLILSLETLSYHTSIIVFLTEVRYAVLPVPIPAICLPHHKSLYFAVIKFLGRMPLVNDTAAKLTVGGKR